MAPHKEFRDTVQDILPRRRFAFLRPGEAKLVRILLIFAVALTTTIASGVPIAAAQPETGSIAGPLVHQTIMVPAVKAKQRIHFAPLARATLSQSPLTLIATATSGLPVSFAVSTPSTCTTSGANSARLTLLGPGRCTVVANQAGDAAYSAARPVSRSFRVTKIKQRVHFAPMARATLAQSPLTLIATSTSGLPVSFTATTAAVCTTSGANGATLSLVRLGSCTVVARQAGDATYDSANPVRRSIEVVRRAGSSATATASVSPASYTGGACPAVFTFSGTVTSPSAGTVTYRWTRSDGATGPTSTLTFTGAGSQTVSTTWTLGAAGTTGTFWEAVQILSPGTATSNQASFTLSCTTPSATATASVSPASYTGGACPAVFTFSGTVTSPSAGTVTYRWTRSDGATGPTSTLTFTGAGSQTVSTTWTSARRGQGGELSGRRSESCPRAPPHRTKPASR